MTKKLVLFALAFFPTLVFGQWSATPIANSTYNSVLRSMSQGVYDHYSDKSFFCFMQENSNPYVVSCDHSSGDHTWGTPNLVYTQPSASKYNYPTIDILPNRKLVLCYASPFDNALGFAISNNPADATSWSTTTVATGDRNHVEYPRIKVDRQGNIYLFFIHMERGDPAHKRWYYYVKSEDEGTTWTEPVLCLQRELDDPYGLCEMYIGYTADEPYRLGEPERWWFAYTASSGFQFEGTHTGSDNSANLTDSNADWGDGGNFDYRWLYNITKGTNSGINDANSNTVYPTETMDWDNGDQYGIAYHNIYHSDIYVVYFNPENGHWFDAAHNDLGTTVSRAEMETVAARPYASPTPPSSKDVGYVQNLIVNNQGYPSTIHNNTLYKWDGSNWNTSTPNLPSSDIRYLWFAEDKYYWAANRLNIFNSSDLNSWEEITTVSLPDNNSFSSYSVFIKEGHAEAYINTHEYRDGQAGMAWAVSAGEEQTAEAIVLRTNSPKLQANESTTIYAYITDKVHGARSRVRNASNSIELTVVSGQASISQSTQDAVNGMAEFTVTPNGSSAEVITLEAQSAGLDSYYLNLFVNGGTLSSSEFDYNLKSEEWQISPNPARNFINIPDNIQQVEIYNLNGVIVSKHQTKDKQTKLPIDLASGTYIVKIYSKKEVKKSKLVVE